MKATITDQSERDKALDINRSFIVHAPAGSGKTELLIQRYLLLLSKSAIPESIRVWTFTRKAAHEMRERVVDALRLGENKDSPCVDSYQYKRWILGKTLYQWQIQQQWDLLNNTHRLNIQTIDSFYAEIVRRHYLKAYNIVDHPEALYQEAIQKLFEEMENDSTLSESLAQLAHHTNNDFLKIEQLLSYMLVHRNQWTNLIPKEFKDLAPLRSLLEKGLGELSERTYDNAYAAFSASQIKGWHSQLEILVQTLAYSHDATDSSLSKSVFWDTLSQLFLTRNGQWRKIPRYRHLSDESFVVSSVIKQELKCWLTILSTQEQARVALLKVRSLPPLHYTTIQWDLLKHLFYILNALLAILKVVFDQHNQVDYVEIEIAADRLLGQVDEPTEALLQLDNQIQHILIDELQDMSLRQLISLKKLITGWQPGDGRTLFLVGDPMQSIYRFRKAEARLFLLMQHKGFENVLLEPITLSTNFRSTAALIKWTNDHFKAIQPVLEAQCLTRNLFAPSHAISTLKNKEKTAVNTHWLSNTDDAQESQYVVGLIQSILGKYKIENNQSSTIAVLGRTRQHLLSLLPALKAANIHYQAIDIETLIDLPIIQDLLTLTRGLVHLGDDIAWLALLRAPWCGLSLEELYQIRQATLAYQPSQLIWEQLIQIDKLSLSQTAAKRVKRFVQAITPMLNSYGRESLARRVMNAWYALEGPLMHSVDTWKLQDVDTFFACIDAVQVNETIIDIAILEKKLQTTYVSTNDVDSVKVKLMTIHKAKGLEFDTVIVTSLHRGVRYQAPALILFDEQLDFDQKGWLLAPIKSSDQTPADPIYQYLYEHNIQQDQAEVIRLLYVACTRAKYSLHLVGTIATNQQHIKMPRYGSFLYWLWQVLEQDDKQHKTICLEVEKQLNRLLRRRLI